MRSYQYEYADARGDLRIGCVLARDRHTAMETARERCQKYGVLYVGMRGDA